MTFTQIIEYSTTRADEMKALSDEFAVSRTGESNPTQVIVHKDRDNPDRYLVIASFPSHEVAMANSSSPETQEFAAKVAALCDGPPTFRNLDEQYAMFGG